MNNRALNKLMPSFNEPLEMIRACHDRIRIHCHSLERLGTYLEFIGCNESAQRASGDIIRFFDIAVRHHFADEEQSLLPVLLEIGKKARVPLDKAMGALQSDHLELNQTWSGLRANLQKISTGQFMHLDFLEISHLNKKYHDCLIQEETRILPFAQHYLHRRQLDELRAAMIARRAIR
ncbi:MAG: hemerythrin domain-containing protein [Pseudomonadota bacterium]|nr:hemerythrin domain-containing protein [Pseudomonadota bacterium]